MRPIAGVTYPIIASMVVNGEHLYSAKVYLAAATANDYGVCELTLTDTQDHIIAKTCVLVNSTTPTVYEFILKDAPSLQECTLSFALQGIGNQQLKIGVDPQTDLPVININTATNGQVTSLFEANINGTITVLFTFKTSTGDTTLYRMATDGTVTKIRDLPAGVEHVRYAQNINKIRYADGKESPRIIDPTTWTDTAITTIDLTTDVDLEIKTSNILPGTQDNMIYFDADTTTQAVWTYPYGYEYMPEAEFITSATLNKWVDEQTTVTTTINENTLEPVSDAYPLSSLALGDIVIDNDNTYGEITAISGTSLTVTAIANIADPINSYDKFDRDFRQNFPAIETGDPLTAMFNLGGIIYFLTRRNKYYLYAQTADVWTQQTSSAQHGTFSQESCACDLNYAYYANDDGVYVFDGSSEASITQNTIQNTYDAIQGKESIVLELYNNRLYVFYSSTGTKNDSCLVYNINLKLWESFDTGTVVSATIGRQTASNRLICGSSRFGQLYTYDNQTNAYADVGAPIDFDLETAYLHFGTPSQLHRITKWRPEFSKVDGDYTIKCGYALDFTDDVKYAYSINLKNDTVLSENYVWDNPQNYGAEVAPTKLTTIPKVYGEFRRCQIRYQHHAAFQPVNFKSHTLTIQTQRIR